MSDPLLIARETCARYSDRPEALLEILHDVQDHLGYIPKDTLPVIAERLNISRADIHGVVTFYKDFRQQPPGKHVVKLCRAEACQSMGSERLAAEAERALGTKFGETASDGSVTLEVVYCLGNCALAPSAMIDDQVMGRVDISKLKRAMQR
jgi:formate dehydrogenase subunit gamma